MNQLKHYPGGIGLEWEDFDFLMNGVKEALKGLARVHKLGDTFILNGMEFTVALGNLTHTEGFVVVDGEICHVEALAAPLAIAGAFIYLEQDETYDPAGAEATLLAGVVNTYAVRKGKLVSYGVAQPGKTLYSDLLRPTVFPEEWTSNINTGVAVDAGAVSGVSVKFRSLIVGKTLHFLLYAQFTTTALCQATITPDLVFKFNLPFDTTLIGSEAGSLPAVPRTVFLQNNTNNFIIAALPVGYHQIVLNGVIEIK